jgi:hypothetical protein
MVCFWVILVSPLHRLLMFFAVLLLAPLGLGTVKPRAGMCKFVRTY